MPEALEQKSANDSSTNTDFFPEPNEYSRYNLVIPVLFIIYLTGIKCQTSFEFGL